MNNVKRLQVAKVKCLNSLSFYTRYFFKELQRREFVIGEHHKLIWEALEKVLNGQTKRLIINIAPRYGKTELAVKNFVGHALALNPAARFIHLSYGDDIALDNSEAIKDTIQSEQYQTLFPEVQIKKDSRAKDKWYTTQGGGVLARAAGGQVTGFGAGQVDSENEKKEFDEFLSGIGIHTEKSNLDKKFSFSGAIIIDDPIKPEDADQDTIREKVNSRFDSTIRNRVNSRETPIIVIMQRLHPNDLAGYLQRNDEADKWEVLSLPCIKEDGSALWPFKHNIEELKRLEKSNEIVFARQYMQNPKPKAGLLFPEQELNFFNFEKMAEQLEDPDFCYVPVDPANEGGDDFAAGPFKLIGDKIYLPEVLYNTEGTDYNEPRVCKMVINSIARAVGVESVFGWKETAKRIREDLQEANWEGDMRMLKPRQQKHSRILNMASFIKNHIYFRDDWANFPQYAKFMRVLTSYKKIQEPGLSNKHDDAPDLCEMAASYYEKNFRHLW